MTTYMPRFRAYWARTMFVLGLIGVFLALTAHTAVWAQAPKPDPGGTSTGAYADVFGMATNQGSFGKTDPYDFTSTDTNKITQMMAQAKTTEPFAAHLADAVGRLKVATNFGWTLNTGYLVLFMQAGFALLTCGLVRKKNAAHLMMLNFAAYVVAFIGYYICGFAFQFGAAGITNGIQVPSNLGGTPSLNKWLIPHVLGGTGFFLKGGAYDVGANALCLFEVVFMETAGYIIVGAICERITFGAFVLCELFIGAILYPIFGCWCWGGGWLANLGNTMHLGHGYVDFAGSTVVHAVGGFAAMALAVILGPRLGKYGPDGKPRAFPAHNIAFVVTGTFILLFGWMGFNPGSTLGDTDLRISVIAVNTNLAAIFGAAAAMVFWYLKFGKPDISMACNGMLAGLVAITAPCAFVSPTSAMVIGILAGITVCWGVLFNDNVLKIDDPCGAISVHGYCGWLGGICLGLFADGTYGAGWNGVGASSYLGKAGLGVVGLFQGDTSQFLAQLVGSTVCVAWSFGLTFIVFKVVNAVKSMRVSPEVETMGLDEPEFGIVAYPDDVLATPSTPSASMAITSAPNLGGGAPAGAK
ncbi:MAG TPA: ammonium transporter [Chthonomonas sp.]|uniref:ammonium transporter n=1 Tax=Chthonomonas sp. TaxID=2282153 RepID=UPI002B4B39A0|nr:ammonium transporter [Chthonomonas sp.]HLI50138.1 ammonium transporter [Chthonomonas sp.]